jgi:hypothetical protein
MRFHDFDIVIRFPYEIFALCCMVFSHEIFFLKFV